MAQSFNTSMPKILVEYVKCLNIPVSKSSLLTTLQINPYYPTLYSISETFNRFKIENASYKIDEKEFEKLTPPFLVYLSVDKGEKDFVMVSKIEQESVTYFNGNKKYINVGKEEFYKNWQNIVFLANVDEKSGEKNYKENRRKEQIQSNKKYAIFIGGIIIFFLSLFSLFSNATQLIPLLLVSVTKILGLIVTMALLWYEIDKSNTIIKNICTGAKQLNCDAVINSKASKIFGMSWSEVGFFYFSASFLFLIFPSINFSDKISYLAITSTISSTYIVFSIYYQWRVVKQWCPLCLTVLGILLLELIWAVTNYWMHPTMPSDNCVLTFVLCILLPIIIWYAIKPIINKAKNASDYEYSYKRLLYNSEVFDVFLQQRYRAPEGWKNIGISIGNPNASKTIIKICNPYCGPCAKAHPTLEEIVQQNENVNLKIIFYITNDEENKIVSHLLAIHDMGNSHITQKALDDWYLADKKDYVAFATKYPVSENLKNQQVQIDAMRNWCIEAGVTYTPTIFINGRWLPESYNIKELTNIL